MILKHRWVSTPGKKHNQFPFYLPQRPSDKVALAWLGKRLREKRATRTPKMVASAANVSLQQVRDLEKGIFHIGLGQLRRIVSHGYGTDFSDLMADCFKANREAFDAEQIRPFDRDYYYAITQRTAHGKGPTAVLIGGDPKSFLWAIPMRRLKNQPMVTEYLELSPKRKRLAAGLTPGNVHDGSEVLFVIHGSVTVHIAGSDGERELSRDLERGDAIHFRSLHPHNIENTGWNTTAFLLVVRLERS
jgi:mannose-6-phosphate isomerase-like protein (cupin superfamily)